MNRKRNEQKLKNIAKVYLLCVSKDSYYLPYIENKKIASFQSAVELAYCSLTAPLQKIINNDFFYQDYPGWWKSIYKKNNYQKLKNSAIKKFLEVFYEI